MKGDTQ